MKTRSKRAKSQVPFDPVLFAATVPARKPTAKDAEDAKEQKDDAIEAKQYESMEDMLCHQFD
jgi:hypothetical protein